MSSAPVVPRPVRVVALGGGHGLGATLQALRTAAPAVPGGLAVTAVVTVADNGGSSGRLRLGRSILPPGDLRMAMVSLLDAAPAAGADWSPLIQHRFDPPGELAGHPLGNLLLLAAWERTTGAVAGLDLVGGLLGVRGRVLPMCPVPLDIAADVQLPRGRAVVTVRGQAEVARSRGRIRRVWLEPADPPACPEAVEALLAADWVVLGPGSWFTSVLPHLLVPDLREALTDSAARVLLSLNLDPSADETAGYPLARHLQVLRDHAPDLRASVVLADAASAGHPGSREHADLSRAAAAAGAQLLLARLAGHDPASGTVTASHDVGRYAAVLAGVLRRPADSPHPDPLSEKGKPNPDRVAGSPTCR